MNRELKFRAWDEENNEFHYFDLFGTSDGSIMKYHILSWGLPIDQYLGLKDKSGAELYERDIIKNHDKIGYIFYSAPMWLVQYNKFETGFLLNDLIIVIGNIHEDKNLLNEIK